MYANTLFHQPMTNDEVLQEAIRRINHLIAQRELYEAYWLGPHLGYPRSLELDRNFRGWGNHY